MEKEQYMYLGETFKNRKLVNGMVYYGVPEEVNVYNETLLGEFFVPLDKALEIGQALRVNTSVWYAKKNKLREQLKERGCI